MHNFTQNSAEHRTQFLSLWFYDPSLKFSHILKITACRLELPVLHFQCTGNKWLCLSLPENYWYFLKLVNLGEITSTTSQHTHTSTNSCVHREGQHGLICTCAHPQSPEGGIRFSNKCQSLLCKRKEKWMLGRQPLVSIVYYISVIW